MRAELEELRTRVAELGTTGDDAARRQVALIEAIAGRLEALEQEAAGQGEAIGAVSDRVDRDLEAQTLALGALRAEIEATSQRAGQGATVEHDGGFRFRAADGYTLRLGGYTQARWSGGRRDDVEPSWQAGGFAFRRTRVIFDGALGPRVTFRTMIELVATPLLWDGWAEVTLGHGVSLRGGRDKVPFTRSFLAGATSLTFTERAVVLDQFRWGRDLGVQLRGAHGAVEWVLGVGNGAVDGAVDRMPSVAGRVAYAALGKLIAANPGDIKGTKATAVTIGVDGVIDAPTVPGTVGTVMIDPDPEKNGTPTRVKVQAASADVTMRRRGLEVSVEALVRRDDWRDALRTAPAAEAIVGGAEPVAMGVVGEVTYMLAPGKLLAGARVAAGDLPVLSMRQATTVPRGEDVVEAALTGMWLHQGRRTVNVTYTFLDYGPPAGATAGSREHRLVVEAQLNL